MPDTTVLDLAHAAMQAAPEDDAARLRFFECLADAELFLMLEAEPGDANVAAQEFALEEGRFVLAFDLEERLAAFADAPAPYAALPGRVIARQLAGQGVGLGLNLGVAPSSFLIPAGALDWLTATLDRAPESLAARPLSFHAPGALPEALLAALGAKLALAGGMAGGALLGGVAYDDGRRGHILAFLDAEAAAEAALAGAVAEALAFSGLDAGEIDVAFLASGAPATARLARVALRLDLPAPEAEPPAAPPAPGMDPKRPPRLR